MTVTPTTIDAPAASHEPYYVLISKALRSQILSGELASGDKLPSEAELGAKYAVSRMTARNAITELVNENLVSRVQGRGAFVVGTKIERRMRAFGSFHEDLASRGLNPVSKTIARDTRRCTPHEARLLDLRPHETILYIERVRFADDIPLGRQKLVTPEAIASGMRDLDLDTHSFYAYLRDAGIPIVTANQRIEAVLDPESAEILGTDPLNPFLKMEKVSLIGDGRPVELLTSIFRGDKFAFDMALTE